MLQITSRCTCKIWPQYGHRVIHSGLPTKPGLLSIPKITEQIDQHPPFLIETHSIATAWPLQVGVCHPTAVPKKKAKMLKTTVFMERQNNLAVWIQPSIGHLCSTGLKFPSSQHCQQFELWTVMTLHCLMKHTEYNTLLTCFRREWIFSWFLLFLLEPMQL